LFVLVILGALREIIGYGSLLRGSEMLFGEGAQHLKIQLFPESNGLLLAILPPGAFFLLGFLIAFKNWIDHKFKVTNSKTSHKVRPEIQSDENDLVTS